MKVIIKAKFNMRYDDLKIMEERIVKKLNSDGVVVLPSCYDIYVLDTEDTRIEVEDS